MLHWMYFKKKKKKKIQLWLLGVLLGIISSIVIQNFGM